MTLADGDDGWAVRPRDVDATTAAVVASAMEATETAAWVDRLRIRWFDGTSGFDADVSVRCAAGGERRPRR